MKTITLEQIAANTGVKTKARLKAVLKELEAAGLLTATPEPHGYTLTLRDPSSGQPLRFTQTGRR